MKPIHGENLRIGQLAKLAGVKPDSVRFYERSGLLPEPERRANDYRVYDRTALARLQFIKQAQALGFSLAEIRRILSLRGHGVETCRCVIGIAEATLAETDRKVEQMRRFADELRANLQRWRKGSTRRGRVAAEFCQLIETSGPSASAPTPRLGRT